jgi:hypothetical protein
VLVVRAGLPRQDSAEFRVKARVPAGQSMSIYGESDWRMPGYVIDHKQALKRGGSDSPGNMQWQSAAEAKAKDRVE